MQVDCPDCGGKSTIYSRKKLDAKVADLYCGCKNPHCGHTFKMTLSFAHTLSPSRKQAETNIIQLLRSMPKEQQELIKAAL